MAFYEKYIISIIVLLSFKCILGQNKCGTLATSGYTVPHGDIVLKYGDPLDITCNLHKKLVDEYGKDASSRLYFTRNNEKCPPEMIETLNSTSIRLRANKHPKTNGDTYYCMFNTTNVKIVCMNVVFVGVPPQDVTDFSCISRNYDNLTCTWTPPENYVKTTCNLTYYLKGRAARFIYNCTNLVKLDNGKMSCFWNVSTEPQYRQAHSTFYFRIAMTNVFGSKVNDFVIEHFKRVLPNPPENLTAVATSPHSIHLSWVIPSSMVSFTPGLHHRILYQCEYYDKVWQVGGFITNYRKNETLQLELRGLKYAHALCDIRVSMRSAVADDHDESMWSGNATITVRTLSEVPDCPPKTNIGSFEIVNSGQNREVNVYWQQIKEEQKNGQNLTYHVEVENRKEVRPVQQTKAYAKFQNLSASYDYVVNIWSKNEKGLSVDKSSVTIPANRINEPLNFIKVAHREDLYELSWEPPRHLDSGGDQEIVNYTIFWCNNERDRPYQCVGNLSWIMVPGNVVKYNKTLPANNIYQFAISANTHNYSSGMSWAECTVIPNRFVGKIKDVWIPRVGADFIEVRWKLDCSNRIGLIKGFIIFYCQLAGSAKNCENSNEKNVTIPGDVQEHKITGLNPYKSYRLTVAFIINDSLFSQRSEPLYNTTNEAAPDTPPRNLEYYNVTNSSISLKWEQPLNTNGHLKYYNIHYNKKTLIINPANETVLNNLNSYENYSIYIEACTVACSKPSDIKHVMTKKWIPGPIEHPGITYQNDTHITISWDKPNPPRGDINYYQVKFKLENRTLDPYTNVTAQNYSTEVCSSGEYKSIFISVRAVNIINGEHKAGSWSNEMHYPCRPYKHVIYAVIAISVLILAVGMTCVFKRLYVCCKVMQDVEVKLPPGLAPVVERDIVPWNSEKHVEDIDRTSRADEELLLHQITDVRLSGESSGCSSAPDSITSLDTTNHISPTDSGTEHPRSPSLNEEGRRNSLRQRNVPTTRPKINKGYVIPDAVSVPHWPPKPSPTPAGNYCVLGVNPSNETETESPYVPIPDMNTPIQIPYLPDLSQPPPYVMTGDFIKTPNPGYVPYSATESSDKNTGYVVAGLTKDLLGTDLLQYDLPKSASVEEKPLYITADPIPTIKGVQFPWQQPPVETNLPKSGYVTVGDAPPPKTISDVTKGYVPHRQFEAKSLKED